MRTSGDLIIRTQHTLASFRDDFDLVESELNRLPPSESEQIASLWEHFNDLRAHLDEVAARLPKLGEELARVAV